MVRISTNDEEQMRIRGRELGKRLCGVGRVSPPCIRIASALARAVTKAD